MDTAYTHLCYVDICLGKISIFLKNHKIFNLLKCLNIIVKTFNVVFLDNKNYDFITCSVLFIKL